MGCPVLHLTSLLIRYDVMGADNVADVQNCLTMHFTMF